MYPVVMDEFLTIAKCIEGKNLARCGDGEAKIACGFGYSREPPNEQLAREMRDLMYKPHRNCIVGVPTYDPNGAKYTNWLRHQRRFLGLLDEGLVYGSAFVSRPDSSPWIATVEYAKLVESLWRGKIAAVVCERKGSMAAAVQIAARKMRHIECPHAEAYSQIDRIEQEAIDAKADIVIMAAGPTATCLANRLSRAGVHAIDLGSCGRFLQRFLQ